MPPLEKKNYYHTVAVLTSMLLSSLQGNAPLLATTLSGAEIMRGLIDGAFPGLDKATRLQLALGNLGLRLRRAEQADRQQRAGGHPQTGKAL